MRAYLTHRARHPPSGDIERHLALRQIVAASLAGRAYILPVRVAPL
jgi:hypothetical protein